MSSDTITLELDKYESGVVFHSLKDKRNQIRHQQPQQKRKPRKGKER